MTAISAVLLCSTCRQDQLAGENSTKVTVDGGVLKRTEVPEKKGVTTIPLYVFEKEVD